MLICAKKHYSGLFKNKHFSGCSSMVSLGPYEAPIQMYPGVLLSFDVGSLKVLRFGIKCCSEYKGVENVSLL